MEYADAGTLKNYLKKNFKNLTWDDKYNLAYQLVCAVSCLHNEGIVHRDLVMYFVKLFDNSISKILLFISIYTVCIFFNSTLEMYWSIKISSSYPILGYQRELNHHPTHNQNFLE